MRSELPVKSNGLHIWTESFGNHLHAPILLIAGAGAQSIFWEDEFCQRLAESERFVVRFDNRDTGLSDSVEIELGGLIQLTQDGSSPRRALSS